MTTLLGLLMATVLQGDSPIRTIDKGEHSQVGLEQHLVVRTPTEWHTLWQRHAPDRSEPIVDFSADMVIGLFFGSRNTAGYTIEVVSARREAGATIVRYRQRQPPRGAITAQVITSPYHLVSIARSSGDVKFEKVE